MPNVITTFVRRRNASHSQHQAKADAARHRRDGWFDEADNWHDAESAEPATSTDQIAR